jgi:hypothetical protein
MSRWNDYDHAGAMLDAEAEAAHEATEPDPPDWILEHTDQRSQPLDLIGMFRCSLDCGHLVDDPHCTRWATRPADDDDEEAPF